MGVCVCDYVFVYLTLCLCGIFIFEFFNLYEILFMHMTLLQEKDIKHRMIYKI